MEIYLNGLDTMRARFSQESPTRQIGGEFLLKRPGRMRFDYDPPVRDFIVSDGLFIYYYDAEMRQQSNMPLSQSLAAFFLRPEVSLSDGITVTGVARENSLLQITLAQSADPLAGSMTLYLSENPLQLRKWRIVDAQQAVTDIILSDAETGIALSDKLFRYYDPEHLKPKTNR